MAFWGPIFYHLFQRLIPNGKENWPTYGCSGGNALQSVIQMNKGLCDEKVEIWTFQFDEWGFDCVSTISSRGVDVCTLVIARWGLRSVIVVPSLRVGSRISAFEVRKVAFRRRGIVLRMVHFRFVQIY
jgi:hypothetical protein